LQTVFLLVCHGATVLTGSISELGGFGSLLHTLLVPLADGTELSLLLLLGPLMCQTWPTQAHIPRRLTDVLRYVRVDVSKGRDETVEMIGAFPRTPLTSPLRRPLPAPYRPFWPPLVPSSSASLPWLTSERPLSTTSLPFSQRLIFAGTLTPSVAKQNGGFV
ncbi:hypothetical protein GBAR_LOCUS18701, partial [Geodia barretti]